MKKKTTNKNPPNQGQQEGKSILKNEDSTSSFWDNFKRFNICIIGVPEGEEKEQEIGNLFEKIIKFLYFGEGNRHTSPRHIESQMRVSKRPTPRYILIKIPKVKENLKSSKREAGSYLPTWEFP